MYFRGTLLSQTPRWYFRKHQPIERARNPIGGEFFAEEAIDRPGQALIRESIQNAIDAAAEVPTEESGKHTRNQVRVRIKMSSPDESLPPHLVGRFFQGIWSHIESPDAGIRTPPGRTDRCEFLTIEDFGTTGLTGDPEQFEPRNEPNAFFHFFRAEGITDKSGGAGGSWGIGKNVFPRSSRVNAMLGLTVRNTDRKRLLMGSITLRHRKVDGYTYGPDGWFGITSGGSDDPILSCSDNSYLDDFTTHFHISRDALSPGLSIVVPWLDPEITLDTLLDAVLLEWFFPILDHQLVVDLEEFSGDVISINASSFPTLLSQRSPLIIDQIEPFMPLAIAFQNSRNKTRVTLNSLDSSRRPKWGEGLLFDTDREILRTSLDRGKTIIVDVPLDILPVKGNAEPSYFSVCLEKTEGPMAGKVRFIRNSIMIPHPHYSRPHGYAGLVVAEHPAVANLLRAAEHPAHTHWSKDTGNFKDVYRYGTSYLGFIRNGPAELLKLIRNSEEDEDRDLLLDLFSLPLEPEKTDSDDQGPFPTRRPRTKPEIPDPPPPRPRRYRISKNHKGFRILPGEVLIEESFRLIVRAAYNCRRGNPLKHWNKQDFRLDKLPIELSITGSGASTVECSDNRVVLLIDSSDFDISVDGFDARRDLFLSARTEDHSE